MRKDGLHAHCHALNLPLHPAPTPGSFVLSAPPRTTRDSDILERDVVDAPMPYPPNGESMTTVASDVTNEDVPATAADVHVVFIGRAEI